MQQQVEHFSRRLEVSDSDQAVGEMEDGRVGTFDSGEPARASAIAQIQSGAEGTPAMGKASR